jgi:hypothetical protein
VTIEVVYVTSSDFKREENRILSEGFTLESGKLVREVFSFDFRSLVIQESRDSN